VRPDNFYFGGGAADTVMHPLVAVAMIVVIILILTLRREQIIAPFLLCTFLIPGGQMLVIGGVHLFVLRIVLLFAVVRMALAKSSAKGSIFSHGLDSVDKVFIAWALFRATAFLILFSFISAAVVNQVAFLLDVFAGYFFLRFLLRDQQDMLTTVKVLAFITAVVGLCMVNEKLRSQNIFGYLGGFRVVPELRDGAVRAQGPFAHPILAGSFGATLLPLFFWLWHGGKSKLYAVIGMIGSTCMVFSSASSTPLMAYMGGIVAVCFWPMRKHMRLFRWALVTTLIGLHLVMKAPVWFLIARVDLTGASSGYHRAMLVDNFVRRLGEWWFVGTTNNANWGYDMWDISNQFVAEGIAGGLATFICFIALISMSFSKIGRARKAVEGDRQQEWFLWFLGSALVSHMVAYWGISYFDHTQISWFALLVMISVATHIPRKKKAEELEAQPRQLDHMPAFARETVPSWTRAERLNSL
jgi:hypothetical protein